MKPEEMQHDAMAVESTTPWSELLLRYITDPDDKINNRKDLRISIIIWEIKYPKM